VVGVLSVDNPSDSRPFTEDDEARLTSLADYAAVALENAGLYEQSQQEISERRRIEQALRESEERYALAVQGANDGLWDWNIKTDQVFFSPRWLSMLGLSEDEIGSSPDEWFNRVHGEDIQRLRLDISAHLAGSNAGFSNEHRVLHKNGSYLWVLARGLAVRDQDGVAYRMAGSLTDITDRRNAEERLIHDAFHDTLTGLPNRALFMDRLRLAVERCKRKPDYQYAVLFLDLDQFKNVNDCLGHLLGDQMLVAVAQLLNEIPRSADTVARFGGDEFVILLEDIEGREGAVRVVEEINNRLREPFMLSNHQVFISASTGVVLSDGNYTKAEDILRDADIAMYSAKGRGRATFEIFEPNMRVKVSQRLALESELRQAFERNEFLLHYQPIVSLTDGQVRGFEALLRWTHPRRGVLLPSEFLSVAEETGLVHSIDRWVLGEACRQMETWHEQFPFDPPLTISVNISGKHFSKPDLVDYISSVLSETGLPATSLKLEITENALMEHTDTTMEVLHQLRSMGVQIQIDDFGIGYSSLSYLSQFPVSALKIDQSFVNLMTSDNNRLKIIQAIVLLTQRLDVVVIAEGVESEDQLAQLKELGCGYGQGYYMSRPIDGDSVAHLLEDVILNGGILTGRLSDYALADQAAAT
jgi:diguanylate cyclase (GGDEF)-like protein/PAS domain S-box-containing protein